MNEITNKDVEQWRSLVKKYFPANHVGNALKVMQCESQGNKDAVGDGHLKFLKGGKE